MADVQMLSSTKMAPEKIGGALARDFLQTQWLRINLGAAADAPATDMEMWCPKQRIRFRLPVWWAEHSLLVRDDTTLRAIYAGFAKQLRSVAHDSDDPELNKSITMALAHIRGTLTTTADG